MKLLTCVITREAFVTAALTSDKPWNLGEEYGRVIALSFVDRFPCIIADEKCILPKVPFELGVCIGRYSKAPDVEHFCIEKGFGI